MNIKYNERGEVISVNGLTTGQHLGTPMQDAICTPEDNDVYCEEHCTITRCYNTIDDLQPVPVGANIQPLEITENGTYNAENGINGYSPVVVNVESSGGDDNFDWVIGDGKTRLYITIPNDARMTVRVYFNQTIGGGVAFNWGDGSVIETVAEKYITYLDHAYTKPGDYVIELEALEGCELTLGNSSSSIIGGYTNGSTAYKNMLKKAEVGNGLTSVHYYAFNGNTSLVSVAIPNSVTSIDDYAFADCCSLRNIKIPQNVTSIEVSAFHNCRSLTNIEIPEGVTSISDNLFRGCYTLKNCIIPESITSIGSYAFYDCNCLSDIVLPSGITQINGNTFANCFSLTKLVVPNSVTIIGAKAFNSCLGVRWYDFTNHTVVPTLENSNAFSSIPTDCEIRVPATLVDEWKAATNWSTYASKIVGV